VKHAYAACLPLRIARGIQNKALEAMAMARPIVATPEAMEGIPAVAGFAPAVAAEPAALADAAVALLRAPPRTEPAARAFVLEHCDWQANLRRLEQRLLPPEEGRNRAAPEAHSTTPPASVAVGAGASTCTPSRRSG
jgi:hypothetical protein